MPGVGDVARAMREVQAANGLPAELKRLRDGRRWSQERLAHEAGMDHSLVSRIESNQRAATQWSMVKLADALAPDDAAVRVKLLVLAGYMPAAPDRPHLLRQMVPPPVYALIRALANDQLSEPAKAMVASVVDNVIALAYTMPAMEASDAGHRAAD